ncbi:hypothetical protein [Arthrobacter monumenti]
MRNDDLDWEPLVSAGYEFLKDVARSQTLSDYTAMNKFLREETGLPGFDFDTERGRGEIGRLLGIIVDRDQEERPGLMMSALVTQKGGSAPATGFYKLAKDKGWLKPGDDRDEFWMGQVKALHKAFAV